MRADWSRISSHDQGIVPQKANRQSGGLTGKTGRWYDNVRDSIPIEIGLQERRLPTLAALCHPVR